MIIDGTNKIVVLPFKQWVKGFPCAIIPVKVLGKKAFVLLDTGANISGFNMNFFNENAYEGLEPVSTIEISGINNEYEANEMFNLDVTIDGVLLNHDFAIVDFEIGFNELKGVVGLNIVGILGADFIEKYGINIDLKQKVIWFTIQENDNRSI